MMPLHKSDAGWEQVQSVRRSMSESRRMGQGICSARQELAFVIIIAAAVMMFVVGGSHVAAQVQSQSGAPDHLQCDALMEPLGIDSPHPMLSWHLHDDRYGARQTAYQIQVASSPALLTAGKPDVWDSGRVTSDESAGVAYNGGALEPSKRYYWRVQVWGERDVPYPVSEISWWETGLLKAENWRAQWIGYEEEEHRRVREANAD